MRLFRVTICFAAALAWPGHARAGEANSKPTPKGHVYARKPGDFVIVCTLFNGPPPGPPPKLKEILITYDPRFVIGARVEEVSFGKSPWPKGETLSFLIHSPALMLGGYAFSGKRFSLTFSPFVPKSKEDRIWFNPETRQLLRWVEPLPEEIRKRDGRLDR
jgi:hypothetical protein